MAVHSHNVAVFTVMMSQNLSPLVEGHSFVLR